MQPPRSSLVILACLFSLACAQTIPTIAVTNLVQCATAEADLVGGVLPYTFAGQCQPCLHEWSIWPAADAAPLPVPGSAFINNEKQSSSDNAFTVTESGAYQFQLTQKAGEFSIQVELAWVGVGC